MPLDPQAKAMMDQLAAANGPKLNSLEPADARRLTAGMFRVPPERAEKVAKVEDRKIPGPAGEIPIRIYTPRALARSRCWFFFMAADG
jgi:acetyl esterase